MSTLGIELEPFIFLSFSAFSCVWLSIYDWKTQTLPAAALALLGFSLCGYYWGRLSLEGFLVCSFATASLWAIARGVSYVLRTNALGGGDIILVFVLSIGVRPHHIPWLFAFSGLFALSYWRFSPACAKGDPRLPFAPALIAARLMVGVLAS